MDASELISIFHKSTVLRGYTIGGRINTELLGNDKSAETSVYILHP